MIIQRVGIDTIRVQCLNGPYADTVPLNLSYIYPPLSADKQCTVILGENGRVARNVSRSIQSKVASFQCTDVIAEGLVAYKYPYISLPVDGRNGTFQDRRPLRINLGEIHHLKIIEAPIVSHDPSQIRNQPQIVLHIVVYQSACGILRKLLSRDA